MAKRMELRREEFLQKQAVLNEARTTLKTEFIGIDKVIDEVIDSVSHWYIFPDLQEKPVIVNLWGLTGVGKSSLIERLAELIDFSKRFYHFDLGNNERGDWEIQTRLEKIYERDNGYPVMLALDEFHHAETTNPFSGTQGENPWRIIWQLMDSGKFQISRFTHGMSELYDLAQELRFLLSKGVKIKNGEVTQKWAHYVDKIAKKQKTFIDSSEDLRVVSDRHQDTIRELAEEQFKTNHDVAKKLAELNGYETVEFLRSVIEQGLSPKTVDCTKALIIVLGNLDRAYTMSSNFNPDMDADAFHKESLKITLPNIKNVLRMMFRYEQVARLGNNHIIYPAFSRDSFTKIIELQLSRIAKKVVDHLELNMSFDPSLVEAIYKEGVYPTQGTRPVFTTIHQFVNSKLGRVVSEMMLKELAATEIRWRMLDEFVVIDYYDHDTLIHTSKIYQQLTLEPLRKDKQDDVQAITAVHEAGHVVVSVALLDTIPEVVYSSTLEQGVNGFVVTNFDKSYVPRDQIISHLAMMLAGRVAEELIFGVEHVTTGATDDIDHATKFALSLLKQDGMGEFPIAYHNPSANTRLYVYDPADELGKTAARWITKAMEMAEQALSIEEPLLIAIANYLSDNRKLEKDALTELIRNNGRHIDLSVLDPDNQPLFYRTCLKSRVERLGIATASPQNAN